MATLGRARAALIAAVGDLVPYRRLKYPKRALYDSLRGSDLELKVDGVRFADLDVDSGDGHRLEAGVAGLDGIRARLHAGEGVLAHVVRDGIADDGGGEIFEVDSGGWHNSAAGIGDSADDGPGAGGLGGKREGRGHEAQQNTI